MHQHFCFTDRHIGPDENEIKEMLAKIGIENLDTLIDQTLPKDIRMKRPLNLPSVCNEHKYLDNMSSILSNNQINKSYIGQGYYGTLLPFVILRNIFENPGWYTQYTPYQSEISQGRLEALLNFQTMVSELCAFPIANASLLDEGTAAAEAMVMLYRIANPGSGKNRNTFIIDKNIFPQTLAILKGRAEPLNIKIKVCDILNAEIDESMFGLLVQYPDAQGHVKNFQETITNARDKDVKVVVATDLLSLCLITPPGELGADVAVGSAQRFGIPMGYGGPHAAFFATRDTYKRQIPGRIIGISTDKNGHPAFRMALQTREQHIRREKATSNICTAQALLAIMAGMYAVYHGPQGLKHIAQKVHQLTASLEQSLVTLGYNCQHTSYFDTLSVIVASPEQQRKIQNQALANQINFHYPDQTHIGISLDETTDVAQIDRIVKIFSSISENPAEIKTTLVLENRILPTCTRKSTFLNHPIFNTYHSETKMVRYIKKLENRDLSLTHSMIPLGSCTMKLNATSEMVPVSFPEIANCHPFAPVDQMTGYKQLFETLESFLGEITGLPYISLQPNSGAQGEFTGLLVIRAYHRDRGQLERDIVLIPMSAHGTNPASAMMAGMDLVMVKCDEMGNIDIMDLKEKAQQHQDRLSALMVTYPSTHGVFEEQIQDICGIIHQYGGQVYMDGANMNAQVGLTSPALIGADVCHLNLHKTFSIPHGGGGPGVGPICVAEHLAPYLPSHPLIPVGGNKGIAPVSSAPWGSASILVISHAYISMMGAEGLTNASKVAILNSNYIKACLAPYYKLLYTGQNGHVAHEMIFDLKPFKPYGIEAEDVAKRLMDYGFHAPTVSFPVIGSFMIEPTESEDKEELDRFCQAMITIREEIQFIIDNKIDARDNILVNAPHTSEQSTADEWHHYYSREQAVFPLDFVRENKFWPPVSRIDNTKGDRMLICTCPSVEDYQS